MKKPSVLTKALGSLLSVSLFVSACSTQKPASDVTAKSSKSAEKSDDHVICAFKDKSTDQTYISRKGELSAALKGAKKACEKSAKSKSNCEEIRCVDTKLSIVWQKEKQPETCPADEKDKKPSNLAATWDKLNKPIFDDEGNFTSELSVFDRVAMGAYCAFGLVTMYKMFEPVLSQL